MDTATDTLGFIGLGVMGSSMAGHLLKAGYTVCGFIGTQALYLLYQERFNTERLRLDLDR
jgi:3-hydroxyisobutyrate dehydrogenase-like beta-hydroxyacid dehydrogenase